MVTGVGRVQSRMPRRLQRRNVRVEPAPSPPRLRPARIETHDSRVGHGRRSDRSGCRRSSSTRREASSWSWRTQMTPSSWRRARSVSGPRRAKRSTTCSAPRRQGLVRPVDVARQAGRDPPGRAARGLQPARREGACVPQLRGRRPPEHARRSAATSSARSAASSQTWCCARIRRCASRRRGTSTTRTTARPATRRSMRSIPSARDAHGLPGAALRGVRAAQGQRGLPGGQLTPLTSTSTSRARST